MEVEGGKGPNEAAQPPLAFPAEGAERLPCSYNECLSGHRWPPQVIVAKCGPCGGPVLAVQKTQCPYCNEPIVRTVLRNDFVPRGAGLSRRCLGEVPFGETSDIVLERVEWREVTEKRFEEREAKSGA